MNTPQDSSFRPSSGGQATGSPGGAGTRGDTEEITEKMRAEGQEQVQRYRDMAADKVDTLADSVQAAAAELHDDDVAHLSRHISDMAGSLGRMADGLRDKSADQILRDVRGIARENPTLFIAGSIAIGFALSRFARASAPSPGNRGESAPGAFSGSTGRTRWSDADSAVPGTTASPATGDDTVDTASPGGLSGAIPSVPGPAASTADAISARAGAAASETTTGGQANPSSTDTLRGSNQP